MPDRKRHPIKEIEAALRYAEGFGWVCLECTGHAWGKIQCPWNDDECRCGTFCQKSVWSTPQVPEDLARQIRRAVDGCVKLVEQNKQSPGSKPKIADDVNAQSNIVKLPHRRDR